MKFAERWLKPAGNRVLAWLKRFWWIPSLLVILFGVAIGYALSIREGIFRERLEALLASQREKGLDIQIGESGFAGLSTVRFSDVSVVPEGRDTLLTLEECLVDIKIWPLLFGNLKLDKLSLSNGLLHLVRRDSISNIDFFLKKKASGEPLPEAGREPLPEASGEPLPEADSLGKGGTDIGALAHRLLTGALYKVPDDMDVRNFLLRINDDSLKAEVLAQEVRMVNGKLESTFVLNKGEATWHLSGRIEPSDRQMELRFYADDRKFEMPYLYDKYQLKLSFDDISTTMEEVRYEDGELEIKGSWGVNGLLLNHPKIAANDIFLESASVDAVMRFGKNWISLDSASTASMKDIRFHPYLKYTLRPQKIYELGVHSEDMDAQAFFDSFPRGLFETLEGMKVKGRLSYHLDFRLNDSIPDSLVFSSELAQHDFEIVEFGKVDFRKINGPYVHTPYNDGQALTSFTVGPSNPDFTPLGQISDYVKDAVNTAEDGNFFGHQGFNEEAFRNSIALNYKTREFERGGSTISMQLVKNVFLDRQKTVARKLEEMMIVWLIEHERLVSKERMYEVYLNVIEWGPDIYGIGPASRFYFSKNPSALSLPESIYLASIVPSPARFAGHWNGDGTIRSSRHWYYKLIRDIMLRRGWITEEEAGNYFYGLHLNGPAEAWVKNNSIEGAGEPDTLDQLLPEGDWLLEGLPGIFGNPAREPSAEPDSLPAGRLSEPAEADSDTLSKREQRRLERQLRREARQND
ncbi:biosynthetic peptidoglycan transglycosylase [Anseongella ginsenosidimutans]|uniref:biosynthetic peptidoglycan transglycosylase n=1 Tax=Anseongella ginsenosidimutans TaxID=496056 RepID=UPI0010484919|nr:biosynthetic peptidoglycan transglycosylase [Anseongella ginsenosidimutans]QEC52057.1 penicillin-binding protein [Anseongella ginsenosidimutans]